MVLIKNKKTIKKRKKPSEDEFYVKNPKNGKYVKVGSDLYKHLVRNNVIKRFDL